MTRDEAASVHDVVGKWLTAAQAKAKFDHGNTLDLAHAARRTTTVTLEGRAAELVDVARHTSPAI
ncbi:MAG TPA: hypothetical protein VGG73_15075, partial [Vicinamibacterales bacterium]